MNNGGLSDRQLDVAKRAARNESIDYLQYLIVKAKDEEKQVEVSVKDGKDSVDYIFNLPKEKEDNNNNNG